MRILPPAECPPIDEVIARLRSPLLRRLCERGAAGVLATAQGRAYDAGESICELGESPEGLWIILEGEVALTRRTGDPDVPATEVRGSGSVFGFDGSAVVGDILARAETSLTTLFVPDATLRAFAQGDPEIASTIAFYGEINARRGDVVRGLQKAVCFRELSARRLLRVLETLDRRGFDEGDAALTQGEAPQGVFVVLSGQLEAWRGDADGQRSRVDVFTPGEVFGDIANTTGDPEPLSVVATEASVCGFLPRATYFRMISRSPAFRRRLGPAAVMAALRSGCDDPEAVVFLGPEAGWKGRAGLTRLVARSLAREHQHKPLLLRLGDPAEAANAKPRKVDDEDVHELVVANDPASVQAAVLTWRGQFDTLFVLPRPTAELARIAPALARVFHVAEDVYTPVGGSAMAAIPRRYCALIGRGGDRRGYPSRTTRLWMTDAEVAALDPDSASTARLSEAAQRGIARLGRGVTERLVGLALGGGGAFGFAHIALIRALSEGPHPVPIDLIGGASFGALVSAFYAAEGLPGLQKLIDRGGSAWPYTQASLVSSRAFQWWVDRLLPGKRMEDLEIPMVPVATDVAYGVEYIPRVGTVGAGVRASGAMPPLFTPVLVGGSRIVDGGFINNVPASVMRNEGASFVVASNVVATQVGSGRHAPEGRAQRFAAALNPFARAQDLVRSSLVLFHSTGARESMTADATFSASFVGMKFWDFGIGEETVRKTVQGPDFEPTIRRIRERWAAFTVDIPEVS